MGEELVRTHAILGWKGEMDRKLGIQNLVEVDVEKEKEKKIQTSSLTNCSHNLLIFV